MKGIKTIIVRDDSGSMKPRRQEVIGEIEKMLSDMKGEESALSVEHTIQFITFDSNITIGKPMRLTQVGKPDYSVELGGMTALLDAVSDAMDQPEEWEKNVVVCVMTDGEENSSRRAVKADLQKRIADKQAQGWSVTFVGPDISAWGDVKAAGISTGNVFAYNAADPKGMQIGVQNVNMMRSAYTAATANCASFDNKNLMAEAKKRKKATK